MMTKNNCINPMKPYKLILLLLLVLAHKPATAQYVLAGKIEYERKTNVYAQYEGRDWFDKFKEKVPKFLNLNYEMVFDTGKTYYKPGKDVESAARWGKGAAPENLVYTRISAKKVTALKTIFETKFLIQDSMRKLAWKEKPEMRTIAGHSCHKAVSVICDSVYIVAFYAEDIPVSGGPEMFGGLPGMILELAVPRLHTTWTATKIEMTTLTDADFIEPQKGKKVSQTQMLNDLKDSFSDWGKEGATNIWWCTL